MKVASLGLARPVYYDRNATTVNGAYYASSAPSGASAIRWTITNTSTQKLFIDSASLSCIRDGAATVTGKGWIALMSPSGNAVTMKFVYLASVNTHDTVTLPGSVYVSPGSTITAETYDSSTGGTILYGLFAHGVQYDA